jgi:hypothetical protein
VCGSCTRNRAATIIFDQTDADSVIIEISGYGPTDTHYFEARNHPKTKEKS